DGGIGCSVDHHSWRGFLQTLKHRTLIADAECVTRASDELHVLGRSSEQRLSYLPAGAGDQHFHGNSSACLKLGATASLPDSTGAVPAGNGHWMPMSGSFQMIARSHSGA